MKTLAIGAAVVAVLAGIVALVAPRYAQERAEGEVEAFFAHLPPGMTGKHGAVTYALFGDRLTLADVLLEGQEDSLKRFAIGRLEIAGLNGGLLAALLPGRNSAGSAVEAAELSAVEIVNAPETHQTYERVSLRQPRYHPPVLAAGEAPRLAPWLAAFEASAIEIANLHAWRTAAAGRPGFDIKAPTQSLTGLAAGRIATQVTKNLAGDIDGQQKFHFEAVELRATDFDLAGWVHLVDPAEYAGDRDMNLRPLLGEVALTGLTLSGDGFNLVGERLALSGLGGRQWPFPPSAAPAKLTPAQSLDLLRSLALGGVEIKNVQLTGTGHELRGVSFGLGNFRIEAGAASGIAHAVLADLAFKSPAASFALGTLELDGLDYRVDPALFAFDPHGAAMPPWPRLFWKNFRLAGLSFRQPLVNEISLQELAMRMSGSIDKPGGSDLDMSRLGLDLGAIARLPGAAPLIALGYGQVFFEAHGHGVYDAESKTAEVTRFSFGAPQVGTLSLAYRLANYPGEWQTGRREGMEQQLMAIAVERAELRYDDASLFERLLKLAATQMGESADAVRQLAITTLEQQKLIHQERPVVANALAVAEDFVRQPTSIRLTATPQRPLAIKELMALQHLGPEELADALGVTVDRP